ncbi:hypothetical protein ZOSMA_81G00580 [Zostera marina]|uniref:Uncharacterized protein n=1 Tax=Zostera marina TaxID=29655 RepID=A0A0K9NPC5_ZOSMR|nr:hypothetical protein ZOSMA_81G00580 [Zostera marina]
MTLDLIRNAGDARRHSDFPVVIDPVEIFPKLVPSSETSSSDLVHPVSGWEIPASISKAVDSINDFNVTLTKILKKPKRATRDDIMMITTFPIKKLRSLNGNYLTGLVACACVALDLWDRLTELMVKGVVGNGSDLCGMLISKNKAGLLCKYIGHVSDLRSSELTEILGFFLNPTNESFLGMIDVKKEWDEQGLDAIKSATSPDATDLTRDIAVLLMMACDGFSPSESCLHHLFSSISMDDILVIPSVISALGSQELSRLLQYFRKWIEKYLRFPEATPHGNVTDKSPATVKMCKHIPTLDVVVMGLSLVLEQQYGYLVMNTEFHQELKMLEGVVRPLVAKAKACCGLANAIDYLQKQKDQSKLEFDCL